MIDYFLVFIFQMSYIIVKFIGIRHIVGNVLISRLLITSPSGLLWLIATSLSVAQMMADNYYVAIPYILGNALGVLLENKIRNKI